MKKKCYVYYEEFSGKILEIIKQKKDTNELFMKCDIEEVVPILAGKVGIGSVIVIYDKKKKKNVLMEKNSIISLQKVSNKPYKIPHQEGGEFDIRLKYYEDNVLEVTIDMSRLSPLYNSSLKDEIKFEFGSEFRIEVRDKDNDDIFQGIVIPANDLLNSVSLYYELYDHISPDKVNFFTERVFEKYYWVKGKKKLTSPMKNGLNFYVHKADTERVSDNFSYHIVIESKENKMFIRNNISELGLLKIYEPLQFYIVDKQDPNILHETFFITPSNLESNDILEIELNEPLSGNKVLYNHKYISVLVEEK